MASYAPLFANVNYKKWNPDLINFDSHRVYGTPSYYVQQMFSRHRGQVVLPVRVEVSQPPRERIKPGRIGVGTWATQAEFKDLKVTQGSQTLYASDFAKGTAEWKRLGGQWAVQDASWRQSSLAENVQAVVGDTNWSDYTYTLKARKLGGAEGFLVMFQVQDERNWLWWNVGGWGNQRHAVERCENGGKSILGKEVGGQVETGRWYDLRLELEGRKIRCFLDRQLIHEVEYPELRPLFASGTLDGSTGETIVKLVNAGPDDLLCVLQWEGAAATGTARAQMLSAATSAEENSLSDPLKVSPRNLELPVRQGRVEHTFPGNSVSVIRLALGSGRTQGSNR
jgi:alpha-L-arabinofuranosidase